MCYIALLIFLVVPGYFITLEQFNWIYNLSDLLVNWDDTNCNKSGIRFCLMEKKRISLLYSSRKDVKITFHSFLSWWQNSLGQQETIAFISHELFSRSPTYKSFFPKRGNSKEVNPFSVEHFSVYFCSCVVQSEHF